jgi:adenylate kinase
MDKGELVPDEVTIRMLESEVQQHPGVNGFIFDGFPRTSAQATSLDRFLEGMNSGISCMLALEVNEEELRERLLKRAASSGRPDDADPKIIQNRIEVYNRETAPVAEYYKGVGKYRGIDGIGSIDEIFNRLCEAIDSVITH